jgi:hypothetical protein
MSFEKNKCLDKRKYKGKTLSQHYKETSKIKMRD